jgi:hypothetical protein
MNILIENPESAEFFTGEGQWSKDIADALTFRGTVHALRAAKQESIGRFNIVGYFADTRQFINLNHGRGKGAGEAAAE